MPPAPFCFFNLEDIVKLISVWVELGDMWWWLAKAHPVLSGVGVSVGQIQVPFHWMVPLGARDEELRSLLGPHPYYCSWVSVLYLFAILLHSSEAEKGLDLWVWFMTDICKAIAFSLVLANIRGSFCQRVKYLEIRRPILLLNKSSFNDSHIWGPMCWTERHVWLMHKCQSVERSGCIPHGDAAAPTGSGRTCAEHWLQQELR